MDLRDLKKHADALEDTGMQELIFFFAVPHERVGDFYS
jgi:hypothetical protein